MLKHRVCQMRISYRFRVALVAVAVTSSSLATVASASAQSGREAVGSLIVILSKARSIDEHVKLEATRYIDYETMAQTALGDRQWAQLSAAQQRDFVVALRQLVEHRYYKRWQKIFENGKLCYLSESRRGQEIRVDTVLTVGRKKDKVTWRLAQKEGEPRIISLAVDDRDLLTRVSKRFRMHLGRRGIDGLIAWLREESGHEDEVRKSSLPGHDDAG